MIWPLKAIWMWRWLRAWWPALLVPAVFIGGVVAIETCAGTQNVARKQDKS